MQESVEGSVLEIVRPGDEQFERLRHVFNDIYDPRPALIALPRNEAQVQESILLAERYSMPLAVRGGGHSLAGRSTVKNGLVVDLRNLAQIVDNGDATYWIGGGAKAGSVLRALDAHNLALPLGDSPDVGIGGITLGGGIGWLTRHYGLTLDHLEGVNIITASGDSLMASRDQNPDLFWALRGGGGGYGIVTRFLFRPVQLAAILGGAIVFRYSRETLGALLHVLAQSPNEMGSIVLAMRAPPFAYVPAQAVGSPVIALTFVWSGEIDAGLRLVEQLCTVGELLGKDVRIRRYFEMYELADGAPDHVTDTTETLFADKLDYPSQDAIEEAVTEPTLKDTLTAIEIRPLGGALPFVAPQETAFAHRGRKLLVSVVRAGFPASDYQTHRAWVSRIGDGFGTVKKGAYINFIERTDADPVLAFPLPTRERLERIRTQFDPGGVFAIGF